VEIECSSGTNYVLLKYDGILESILHSRFQILPNAGHRSKVEALRIETSVRGSGLMVGRSELKSLLGNLFKRRIAISPWSEEA
jgi:hypothetical protein